MRKTKIICTIGPASQSPEKIREMIEAGMNVCRCNFSHGSYEEQKNKMMTVVRISEEMGIPVAEVTEAEENNDELVDELAVDIDVKKFDLEKILNVVETYKEFILKGTLSVALAYLFVKYGHQILWFGCLVALVVAIYGTIDGFLKGMRKEEN